MGSRGWRMVTIFGDLIMMQNFIDILKFNLFILVLAVFHGCRYFLFRKKVIDSLDSFKNEISGAIKSDKVTFWAFVRVPDLTGNDSLDLLLFKTHRSAKFTAGLLKLYPMAVLLFIIFIYFLANK
jgi:hypothetical protein